MSLFESQNKISVNVFGFGSESRGKKSEIYPLYLCKVKNMKRHVNLLLISNGTLALQVAYKALGVKRAICTPFSYIATASSLEWDKIPTSFVDIDLNSLNLCPSLVDKKLELEKLKVTDLEILMNYVASGVEPRNIKLKENFYDEYSKIAKEEIDSKGYFEIIKRSPLYICKKTN